MLGPMLGAFGPELALFELFELAPLEPDLALFGPEYEPELVPYEPELVPYEPELVPYEPELVPYEPELVLYEPVSPT